MIIIVHNKHISGAYQAQKTADAFYVFDQFDTFFSVIENAAQLQIQILIRAVDILYRTTETLGQMLNVYFKQETLDRQNNFLNLTKMVIYLLVSTIKVVDIFVQNNTPQSKTAGRKIKKTADDSLPHFASYAVKRYDVLTQVCNIMQMPIEKLWDRSIVADDFIK